MSDRTVTAPATADDARAARSDAAGGARPSATDGSARRSATNGSAGGAASGDLDGPPAGAIGAGPAFVEAPGQRAGVAVDLIPGDVKALFMRQRGDHGLYSLRSSVMSGASGFFMPTT